MATVIMPKMGDAMEEGTLLKWLKNPGDEVAVGAPPRAQRVGGGSAATEGLEA